MNDYSKTITHLKKTESLINKKKLLELDNNIKKKLLNQKQYMKIEKIKKDINNNKSNSNTKNHYIKKISANPSKSNIYKKRAHSFLEKEKHNTSNNQTISVNPNVKKIMNNKSFNYKKNKSNNIKPNFKENNNLSSINDKIMKRVNENSRNNHNNFFENYEKNKIRKKLLNNNNENNNDNSTNYMNKTSFKDNATEINEQRFAYSYFNTIFNNNNNDKENKKMEDNYFSLSQNIGNKKSNILRKINTNISINNDKYDKYKKDVLITEQEYNRSNSQFCSNQSKENFYSNYLINNNNAKNESNNNNNNNEENIKSYNYVAKYDINNRNNNTIQNKQKPLKINDNNTTINLAGSYNFHQYFNTIINNRNNNSNGNNSNNNNNISNFNRNYNRNKITIDNYHNKLYNNVNYPLNSIENDNKNNNNNGFYVNDKIFEDINELRNDLDHNLLQNPTNSKSKKYNTLRHSFEKLLKLFNAYFYMNNETNCIYLFLHQLLIGFHEVVIAFSAENRKLKELNYKLTEEYEKIDKNLIECNKIIKEKQQKIDILEKKLHGLVNNGNNMNKKINNDNLNIFNYFNERNITKDYNINIKCPDKNNEQFQKITKINENNLDDLDALYFFDKIDMKPKRALSCDKIIPFLPISKLKK